MTQRLRYVCNFDKCTGCSLCESLCPQKAISMHIVDGFYRPLIGENCIGCKLCSSNCLANNASVTQKHFENLGDVLCYAAWDKDEKAHFNSTSGGIATLLSRQIIENGGFVVATQFNEKTQCVEHLLIDDLYALEKSRGSKYVNSKKDNIYERAYIHLKEKHCKALFIGVPCEVHAMKQFMKNKVEEGEILYVDLLCRGGASPLCFNQHLKSIYKGKIENATFRGGELDCRLAVYSNKKLKYVDYQYTDPYFALFMKHVLYQPACFHCIYAGKKRMGDITLGDFWGLDQSILQKSNGLGCNMVLINSPVGKKLFDGLKDQIEYYERPLEEAITGNTTLREPTAIEKEYEHFWDEVKKRGFHKATQKIYGISYLKRYVISCIRLSLKHFMR